MASNADHSPRSKRSPILLTLASIYGLLYVVFLATEAYGSSGSEPTVVKLLFLLFLVGYVLVWWHEGLGGAVFVAWWIGMWYLGLFVAHQDRGAGVVMGLPLFVLALLFIAGWYRRTHTGSTTPDSRSS